MDLELYDSLLLMARHLRPYKAQEDLRKLKEQRREKIRKEELALEVSTEKASESYIERLFLWERYDNGECWMNEVQVRSEVAKIPDKGRKRSTLKNQITIWVKGCGMSEHHTPWSIQRQLRAIDYLQDHLISIIKDVTRDNTVIRKPTFDAPMRKALPSLGD